MKSCSNESDLHVKNNEWTSEEWNICALLSKSELPSIFSKWVQQLPFLSQFESHSKICFVIVWYSIGLAHNCEKSSNETMTAAIEWNSRKWWLNSVWNSQNSRKQFGFSPVKIWCKYSVASDYSDNRMNCFEFVK